LAVPFSSGVRIWERRFPKTDTCWLFLRKHLPDCQFFPLEFNPFNEFSALALGLHSGWQEMGIWIKYHRLRLSFQWMGTNEE
jgi:hypothetical protein